MKKVSLTLISIVLCLSLILVGCAAPTTESDSEAAADVVETAVETTEAEEPAESEPVTIGFIMGVAGDAFYISMQRGLEAKIEELFGDGAELIVQGETEWDYTKQVPMVETMLAQEIDLLIIAPNSADAMIEPLRKVADAGIPVITVDTNISDESFLLANVTSDNLQGGAAAADALAGLIGNTGDVAIINTYAGVTTTDARQQGFVNGVAANYPDINIASIQYCKNEQATAAAQIQSIVLQYPDLAGVFATNLFAAVGVSNGVSAKGLDIPIVCYDAGPDQIESLRKGTISATVCQKPLAIGETAAEFAYYYFNGEEDKIEKNALIPSVIVTQDNMDDPEVNKWFYIAD